MIYAALKDRGIPTAYVPFEGESHGFRKAENKITALEAELYFYGRVLNLQPADDLPGIVIDNLNP
jgi:dipeptidyl aminopeptidase/acylaminoacyl peptidase